MSAIPATKVYSLLVPKLGKEETEGLIGFIENRKDSDLENKTKTLATKEDIVLLKEDITSLKLETKQDFASLRLEFAGFRVETLRIEIKQEFAAVRWESGAVRESIAKLGDRIEAKLENRIGEWKAEIIKWMFIFWVSQLLAIFRFIMLFIKE